MRTLIIQLPFGQPGTATVYPHALVQTDTPAASLNVQWAQSPLLPRTDRQTEVVALVPAGALSWHRVTLPAGLHKQTARLKAALQGLLEDALLDDPAQLHLALQAHWKNTEQPWVAACDRAWLSAQLQALESAGITVHRIVPEFAPVGAALHITAVGPADEGWLWLQQVDRGVWGMPMASGLTAQDVLSDEDNANAHLSAEPGVVSWVSERLGLKAPMVAPKQHWLRALDTGWDLAQFEFEANARARRLKNWQRNASQLWHSRDWRPTRWGLGVLLASQLLGLNVWAYKTRADWQAQQSSWAQVLRETFPQTLVVVDAPLQMAREVARLRQGSGQLSPPDLEAMLGALGQSWPAGSAAPSQFQFEPDQLRLPELSLSVSAQQALEKGLNAQGYAWRTDGTAGVMTAKQGQP
ncbi:type II secretion system protein GspL [Limnohabitans sp. DM1]|uniref:type II secretion system protein GspL n=1 Tax=Limnohabitans sp. DM1 TaxID=1597955 RepID=UPI000A6FE6CF|nr:type II secretion system protein GspL [Limnohabitans sp. DM1]